MFNFFMASNKKIRSKSKSMEDIFFDLYLSWTGQTKSKWRLKSADGSLGNLHAGCHWSPPGRGAARHAVGPNNSTSSFIWLIVCMLA